MPLLFTIIRKEEQFEFVEAVGKKGNILSKKQTWFYTLHFYPFFSPCSKHLGQVKKKKKKKYPKIGNILKELPVYSFKPTLKVFTKSINKICQ